MLREQGKLDFDDMLTMCWELFCERKDILSAWQRKYQYLLVDEFQDINRLQYEIVKLLALPENNLFYRWGRRSVDLPVPRREAGDHAGL